MVLENDGRRGVSLACQRARPRNCWTGWRHTGGTATCYALDKLQLAGQFFVAPGEQLYEGMVVGECAREDEMVVNAVRPKEKNNIRTHSHDDAVKLPAPRIHTLETAIEWIAEDELVEVTPKAIRLRKRHLGLEERRKAYKRSH